MGWSALGIALMTAAILASSGDAETGLLRVMRATARTSCALFLAAFVADALDSLRPSRPTRWMKANRGYLFVSFAVSHLFHFTAILSLAILTGGTSLADNTWIDLSIGATIYLLILVMAATSTDRTAGLRTRTPWRRLHLFGAYLIWLAFLTGFGSRVVLLHSPFYTLLVLFPISAMVLRWAPRFGSRRPL